VSIRVLIADDSPSARDHLAQLIGNSPDMQVVAFATNGFQTVHMTKGIQPDVILMDALIAHMDAIEAIREIMDVNPVPIVVICAASNHWDCDIASEVVKAGALTVSRKPNQSDDAANHAIMKDLVNTVRAMSGVHVIRHPKSPGTHVAENGKPLTSVNSNAKPKPEIVSIVASTGGPQTIGELVKRLPSSFNLPIVIVQHITPDFVPPLVNWLSSVSRLPVQVAGSGKYPDAGTIYFAPANTHLRLGSNHHFELSNTPANVPHIPSGDIFLQSVAKNYGSRAVGIVLTGMGNDGAQGLRAMYDAGAITVAQNSESCVVFGMPHEAILLGAANHTLNPAGISKLLLEYAN